MNEDPLEIPQADGADVAHIAASTVLGFIPFAGAGELFKFIITPSLEKRRERWMQLVADSIKELQANRGMKIDELRENEEFTSLLIQTTQAALKTHLESKHLLLKTALINATSADFNFDSKQLYLHLLDRFTPSHILILSLVEKTKQFTVGLHYGQQYYIRLVEADESVTINISEIMFLAFLEDLHTAGLIVLSEDFLITDGDVEQISALLTEDSRTTGLPQINTTGLGRHFLSFVSSY